MNESQFICELLNDKNDDYYKLIIFDYNKINNQISFNPIIILKDDTLTKLVYILEKQKLFIYLDEKIIFKKLIIYNK